MAEIDAGREHPFGEARRYEVVHQGKSYAPKPLIGLGLRHLLGRDFGPYDFSSGTAAGQAVQVLRDLGFEVKKLSDEWSESEVTAIVADYFDMLRLELVEQPYSKTEHRNRLAPKLNDRSKASIEFKHSNISGVLVARGLPYIDGYKPLGNYQRLLVQGVDRYLNEHDGFFENLQNAVRVDPPSAPPAQVVAALTLFDSPPESIPRHSEPTRPWLSRRGRKVDFARRDAENRRLGRMGEQWVVDLEKRRLTELGRDDLATRVEWVADLYGDGLGYDIRSFDHEQDRERKIEVKTTGLGKYFPFLVTANEVRCSEDIPDEFHLYRVFSFSTSPRLYDLPGALTQTCDLTPKIFAAAARSAGEKDDE